MTLMGRDAKAVWHPFTQHQTAALPIPITRGEGAYLFGENNTAYLDLISSWWVNLLGHAEPNIAKAIYQQAQQLEHVIFAGFTHEPAVTLAETLLTLVGEPFSKVFYSDNGSTTIEIALKMAYQYWYNRGETARKRFISFEKGYHGDTFGSMAIGKSSGFYKPFEDLLFAVDTFPYPTTFLHNSAIAEQEKTILTQLADHLERYSKETAGLIIEPLVQGAGGMRMCRPEFLQKLEKIAHAYDVLVIYDEVMTGFYRTGSMFAFQKANTTPDIICLAKGLTGGFLPLAVTLCHHKIYNSFLDATFAKALAHGHSFTANPLGCSAALATLRLLKQKETIAQIAMIEKVHREQLSMLINCEKIENVRYCGTIVAFDLKVSAAYGSTASIALRDQFLKRGLLIRPLGNVIYLLPPYCISQADLENAYHTMIEEIEGVLV